MKPISIRVPTKYELYLQSDEFNEIRQAVFNRDHHKCVVCGSTEDIVPHHLTYRNLYNEKLSDLVTLCNKCHAIYHNVEKRKEYIDDFYGEADREAWRTEMEENRKKVIKEIEKEETAAKLIYKEITEEYLNKDYCKGGPLDMMAWNVLNPVIEKKCEEHNVRQFRGSKSDLQSFFLYRRCEFLLRCMDEGLPLDKVLKGTNFSEQWLEKWYHRKKCEAKIQEEQEIGGIKE